MRTATLEFVVDADNLKESIERLNPLAAGALEIKSVDAGSTKKILTISTEDPAAVHRCANQLGLSARSVTA